MIESVPVWGALRAGWWGWKTLRQRLWPKKPFEIVSMMRDHVEIGHELILVNTSDKPVHMNDFDIVDAEKEGDTDSDCDWVFNREDDVQNFRLDVQEGRKFGFSEGYFFPYKPKHGSYYFRAWVTGGADNPIWIKFWARCGSHPICT